MKIVETTLSDLIFAEYNPRSLKEQQFKQIEDSITRFGIVDPIIVNSNKDRKNIIIGGHQRVKVALKMGIDTVPCHYINLTRDKERELNVRLNKNTGDWDWEILAGAFDAEELTEWGFSEDEFDFPEPIPSDGLTDDDDIPEVEESITKPGDLIILGDHRLLCGDATISTDVEKLMDGQKADMVFTDPPYLMDFTGSVHADGSKSANSKHGAIKNDSLSREDGDTFIYMIFESIFKHTIGAYYVCFYRLGLDYIFRALERHSNKHRAVIIWDKGNHTLSNSDYMSKYEPIIYGWNTEHNFYGAKGSFDIWNIDRTKESNLHPTMKPVELCEKAINDSSLRDGSVLDLFLGSGSTLIACEKTNRKCYGMELDPHYCDVIVKRWEDFTGKKAELEC
jgi:DNA modification methylase